LIATPWAQQRIRLIAAALLRHGILTGDQIGVMIAMNAVSRRRGLSNSKRLASWCVTPTGRRSAISIFRGRAGTEIGGKVTHSGRGAADRGQKMHLSACLATSSVLI